VDDLLTVEEVAARLRCNSSTVLRMIYAGRIPAINIGSGPKRRAWRIESSSLSGLAYKPTKEELPVKSFNFNGDVENILGRFSKKYSGKA
jgi:excisionase family DNA binding protein